MKTLPEEILLHARSLPEGGIVSPKVFLHLGSRSAIDQALSRLAREGKLLRIGRGSYVAPVTGSFGERPPAVSKVIQSLASQNGEFVAPHGAIAANNLGLSRHVPVREAYVTSGRTREIRLGRLEILVKHAPGWVLALGNRPAGDAIRALDWLGPDMARKALPVLRRKLPGGEWDALVAARACFPSWLARAIGEEVGNG